MLFLKYKTWVVCSLLRRQTVYLTNPNTLPSFQAICTRRTSGHCPETFRPVDFPPSQCNNVASFTAQLLFFTFFSFLFFLCFFFANFFYLEKGLDMIFTNIFSS